MGSSSGKDPHHGELVIHKLTLAADSPNKSTGHSVTNCNSPVVRSKQNIMTMEEMDESFTSRHTSNADLTVKQEDPEKQLSSTETRQVARFRFLMGFIFACLALGVSLLVYYYSVSVEQNEFEKHFLSNGNKVIDAFSEDSYRKVSLAPTTSIKRQRLL